MWANCIFLLNHQVHDTMGLWMLKIVVEKCARENWSATRDSHRKITKMQFECRQSSILHHSMAASSENYNHMKFRMKKIFSAMTSEWWKIFDVSSYELNNSKTWISWGFDLFTFLISYFNVIKSTIDSKEEKWESRIEIWWSEIYISCVSLLFR